MFRPILLFSDLSDIFLSKLMVSFLLPLFRVMLFDHVIFVFGNIPSRYVITNMDSSGLLNVCSKIGCAFSEHKAIIEGFVLIMMIWVMSRTGRDSMKW